MKVNASVIVPVYNNEKTIWKCLESLQKQTVKPKEIIVIDDGSTDKTAEVVKKFWEATYIFQEHAGPAKGRNLGARKANGEIIVFLDSDCRADENWLKEMLKPFEDPEIVGVQGIYKPGQKELMARYTQLDIEKRYDNMRKQKFIDHIGSYSAAYRREIFLKFNGFDESFPTCSGEDTEFAFRLANAGQKFVLNPNAFVYHFHPTSLKKHLKTKFFRAFFRVNVYKKHKNKMLKDSYTGQMIKAQIVLFYLIVLAFIAQFFVPIIFLGMIALIVALVLSTLKTVVFALKRDKAVALITVPVEILTTVVFAFGLIAGMARRGSK